ncbi:hypothetical protein AAULR_24491 [Lacticaseibacillus rhamnosus MTCC 5462]|nr:hypothetical protein AAULR_24491 [Lacticaseibacillus rhamnosus MTCC 5462]
MVMYQIAFFDLDKCTGHLQGEVDFGCFTKKHGGIRERYVAKSLIAQQGFKTHNAWIDLLASTGILGFATMIGFSIKSGIMAFRSLKFNRNMLMDGSNFQF